MALLGAYRSYWLHRESIPKRVRIRRLATRIINGENCIILSGLIPLPDLAPRGAPRDVRITGTLACPVRYLPHLEIPIQAVPG